jgi:hypothetical protein
MEMATYNDRVTRISEQVLDGVKKVDRMAVSATQAVTERIGSILPDPLPAARLLSNLSKPEEYVKAYFDFVERFVKTQRTYALDLVKAWEPITGKVWRQPRVRKAAA